MLTAELVKENLDLFRDIFPEPDQKIDAKVNWILDIPETKNHPKGVVFIVHNFDECYADQILFVFLENKGFIGVEYDGNFNDETFRYMPLEELNIKYELTETNGVIGIYQDYVEEKTIGPVKAEYENGIFTYHNGKEVVTTTEKPDNVELYTISYKLIFNFCEFDGPVGNEKLIYIPRYSKEPEFAILRPDIVDVLKDKIDVKYIINASNQDFSKFDKISIEKIFQMLRAMIQTNEYDQNTLDGILMEVYESVEE